MAAARRRKEAVWGGLTRPSKGQGGAGQAEDAAVWQAKAGTGHIQQARNDKPKPSPLCGWRNPAPPRNPASVLAREL